MTEIPPSDLRNHTKEIPRRVEDGEELEVTVNGRSVAGKGPMPRRLRFRTLQSAMAPRPLPLVTQDRDYDGVPGLDVVAL